MFPHTSKPRPDYDIARTNLLSAPFFLSLSCPAVVRKARVSLTRIEVFLGRTDIEGQPMNAHSAVGNGGEHDGNADRAPVGGLLVQHGTFAWPAAVRSCTVNTARILCGVRCGVAVVVTLV